MTYCIRSGKKAVTSFLLLGLIFVNRSFALCPMYFCMAADEQYFEKLVNLIGSIYRYNFEETQAIAIYDLGFTKKQRTWLNTIAKVQVCDLEMTNPDLLKHFFARKVSPGDPKGRFARGWYAWKPVAIKQALDIFPYVLYIDAGMTVQGRLTNLFEHIKQNGCFLIEAGHNIRWMTTKFVVKELNLLSPERKFVLGDHTSGISAGFQGIARSLYASYVLPIYSLTKDMRFFADDGTAPDGFGCGRSDQTLFSIYAQLLELPIFKIFGGKIGELFINNRKIAFRMKDFISFTRENIDLKNMKKHLRYKI